MLADSLTRQDSAATAPSVRVIVGVLLAVGMGQGLHADEDSFPDSVTRQTVRQMDDLFARAAMSGRIPAELTVSVQGNAPLFDCRFVPNVDGTAWYVLLNAQRGKMLQKDREYTQQSLERAIEQKVRIRGRTYYTIVWKQMAETETPLKLPEGKLPETGGTQPRFAQLDTFFHEFLQEHHAAGLAVAIAKDGRLKYSRAFGYADVAARMPMQPDTQMRVASLSKPITAIAALRLIEQKKLQLDECVLPILERGGFRLTARADVRWKDITVRHLLQHSGGWDRDQSGDPMFKVVEVTRALELPRPARQTDILRYQLQQPLDFSPGSRYAYSNFGYSVLGRVMEIVSGEDYEPLMQRLLLQPCGMQKTALGKTRSGDRLRAEARYYPQTGKPHTPFWLAVPATKVRRTSDDFQRVSEPYGRWDLEVMDAHGGWVSTAPDLLRLLSQTESQQSPLVSEASRRQMVKAPDYADPSRTVWYGLGWQVREKRSPDEVGRILDGCNIWHSGALAGTSTLLVRRSDGMSWAVLFNTDRSIEGQRLSTLMDYQMHFAVNSVTDWEE
ncbi:MAG: beta-lactamase family protein [Planctomycetaceae bacterium]|nr:beta-lactamase family protein [Planctomycetaceae bacterium]